jgi:CubicO group peptidase (beta-lactamase class C family)
VAEQLLVTARLPGLSVAVSRGDTLLFAQGFGYADVEARRPVTPDTRFRAASVSKMITATALARLVQAGRLDLDAPVARHVPGYAPPSAQPPAASGPGVASTATPGAGTGPGTRAVTRPITARLLAGHLAGVPHYTPADRIEPRFYASVGEALGVFASAAPVGAPGARYHYSTHGYTLLSAAMEGAAGRPFLDILQQEVVAPLGLRATGPDLRARPDAATAAFYQMRDGAPVRVAAPEDPSYKWAGGGLLSTPSDLVRLGAAYFGRPDGYLRPDVVAAAFASQRLPSGEETGVGLGWRQSTDMDGRRTMEHAGGMEGARSVLVLFPAERVAVAVMTNAGWSSAIEETAHLLARPFLAPAGAAAGHGPAPEALPDGDADADADVTVTLAAEGVAAGGPPRTVPGRLRLAGGRGTLSLSPASAGAQAVPVVYPLVSLGRGGVYALVRPDGAFHLTLARDAGGRVRGRAVRYWTLLRESPAGTAPFLAFETRPGGRAAGAGRSR